MLSGETHRVITGVALRRKNDGTNIARAETTQVRFRDLGDSDIARYVASGEGRDKAGSYAVQGLGAASTMWSDCRCHFCSRSWRRRGPDSGATARIV